ncbi:hepatic triacylglycerol lipase isoform X3 [Podarcis raffonei]|uniref:hepatic triacylglycerol lipase isoform X3 n=1 Tax=Podarcis raffonei TaxID=65483 RepID=UPI00232938B5|nr:hepatic triacylglycerol lipase isoform X3 [Podarcis raffonei]
MRSFLIFSLLFLSCLALSPEIPKNRKKKRPQLLPVRRTSHSRSETKFLLYSNTIEEGCLIEFNQFDTLEKCRFNASLPLVMIVHGWSVDGRLEGWIWKLAEALKSQLTQTNVIITDWLALAHAHYPIAVQNTRDVGQEIARFLEWLEESVQFSRGNAHLIGYSLGAHVSGFAGSYIRGARKIGRITGLDPAGPLFEGMSPTDRLSPDDADFVDAIHTFTQQQMGLSVGIKQPVAHFDFYPNGGTFQPGCHIMHVYNHIVQYGITVHHYQFKFRFINEFKERQIDPTFTISLTGSKDNVENLSITLVEGITGNKTYTFLVPLEIDIGELMMIKLKWEGIAIWENIWNTVQTIIPWGKGDRRLGLIMETIRVKAGETQQKMTFCSQSLDDLHLYPGQEKMFVRCEVSSQRLR